MKKLLSLVLMAALALSLVFALASCEQLTAYQLVSDAVAKTNGLDAVDAEMKMNMKTVTSGITMDVPVTMSMKATGLKGENPIVSANMVMPILGEEMPIEVYNEGDDFYIVMAGEGMKMKAGEYTEEYDVSSDFMDVIKALPEDVLKDVEIVKNSDGTKTVSVAISDAVFAEVYKDLLDSTKESAGGADLGADVSVSGAKVEITVNKDGYVSSYKTSFTMEMTISVLGQEIKTTTEADIAVTYKNPGAAVTITPPEGYQNFPEFDPSELDY